MDNNTKINAVYQYIDDIIAQTDNDKKVLNENLREYLKKINENFAPYIRAFIGIMSAWGTIIIPIQIFDFTLSLILLGILGNVILILYLTKRHIISKINDAIDYRQSMYIKKRKCFLSIKKDINFYHHSRVDIFLKEDNIFSDKVNRTILWTLYNLDFGFNIFNLDYYKLLYKTTHTYEGKRECIDTYFKMHTKLLEIILILNTYKSKALPFFIKDEINFLIRDHLNFIPKYYMQPDAKIQPNFDISLSDFIEFNFGGMRKLYKDAGYQNANLIYNTLFRKRFFIDKNLKVLEIK